MAQQQTRLFVAVDPTEAHQPALVKALLIAKLGNCQIHAFLCTYKDMQQAGEYTTHSDLKRNVVEEATKWLEQLMQPCRISGVPYTTQVTWNKEWVDSTIHAVEKSGCDLVIKSSFHHSKARRFFSTTSDYELMHRCACPILFTHQDQEWKTDRMLACLDLVSGDPQHMRLNTIIIRDAQAFADIVGMDLYVACAYLDAIDSEHLPLETHGHEVTRAQLGELYEVKPERVFLRQGNTVETLKAICDEIDPSIVIIGTLARTGIKGKLIGNTAEKLIDIVDADLLTVN
ncbi:MAG: universal stress protein [Gammaproteobacteria bacterium]|nr:universal stress protein [Gammaproteobacteria bacterium]